MKKVKKGIFKEGTSQKTNYYKKVAKLIANSLVIDHDDQTVTFPFLSPFGLSNIPIFRGRGMYSYRPLYNADYMLMPEFPIFLLKTYAIPEQPGIYKFISKHLQKDIKERLEQTPLTESNNNNKKSFFTYIINNIISKVKWSKMDDEYIMTLWPMYPESGTFVNEVSFFTKNTTWSVNVADSRYLENVLGVSSFGDQQFIMDQVYKKFKEIILNNWDDKPTSSEDLSKHLGNINESVSKQERYYLYILDDLMSVIGLDYKDELIYKPFFMYVSHRINSSDNEFYDFIKEKYGVNKKDERELHKRFTSLVNDKIHDYFCGEDDFLNGN